MFFCSILGSSSFGFSAVSYFTSTFSSLAGTGLYSFFASYFFYYFGYSFTGYFTYCFTGSFSTFFSYFSGFSEILEFSGKKSLLFSATLEIFEFWGEGEGEAYFLNMECCLIGLLGSFHLERSSFLWTSARKSPTRWVSNTVWGKYLSANLENRVIPLDLTSKDPSLGPPWSPTLLISILTSYYSPAVWFSMDCLS